MKKAVIEPAFLSKRYIKLGKLVDDNTKYLAEAGWDCSRYWGFGLMSGMDYRNNDIDGWTHVDSTIIESCWKDIPKLTMFESHVFQTETEIWQFIELMQQFYKMRETAEVIYSCGAHVTSIKKLKDHYRSPEMVSAGRHINRVIIPGIIQAVYDLLCPADERINLRLPSYWGDWATPDEYLANAYERGNKDRPRVLTEAELEQLKEAGA